mgnify:CR=1 FL=1
MHRGKKNSVQKILLLRVTAVVLVIALPTILLLVVAAVSGGDGAALAAAMRTAAPIAAVLVVVGVLVAEWVTARFAKRIALTITDLSEALDALKNGSLSVQITEEAKKGEMGTVADSLSEFVSMQRSAIQELITAIDHLASRDLSYHQTFEWTGEWAQLGSALTRIREALTDLFIGVREATDQTASGADQVASGSQALAQGATEQASSIEELSATVTEISGHIKKNAANAEEANRASDEEEKKLEDANAEMAQMVGAMDNIRETSKQIGNIIKTIDDIAFQTNILALNAAVEAARAGAAGKGFAVVADEVRNLASKSAEAAKDTTALIENAIKAVGNGSKVADSTEKILTEVMQAASRAKGLIDEIAKASERQATSIGQITQGVQQISAVVQTNSATAEQSAAASEELAAQAKALKGMLGTIKLDERKAGKAKAAPAAAGKAPARPAARPAAVAASAAAADDKYV